MASPDVSTYIDLTLYDSTPEEIAAAAEEYARVTIPEFERIPGSVEDAMIQAQAQMTSELKGSINRMTPGAVEVLLALLGIDRDTGTQATGVVEFTLIDSLGHTIPAGTRVGYRDTSDPLSPVLYPFDTVEDLIVPASSTTGSVAVTATLRREYPALQAGQTIQLLTPIAFISSVALDEDVVQGTDAESDADYFSRAIGVLNSYSQALVLPTQFDQYVLNTYNDIYRCKTYSRVDYADDTISGWTADNGYITVYVSKVGGASVAAPYRTAIEEDLTERAVAGLNISVENAHLESVDVSVEFTLKAGWSGIEVRAAVEAALNAYVHPDYWNWGPTIYINEIISLVDQVPGVDVVALVELDGSATDYNFAKFGSLPVPTLSVSVT